MGNGKDEGVSTSIKQMDRRIIPRWRDSSVAATTGELNPFHKAKSVRPPASDELADRISDWMKDQSLAFATDLVSAGMVVGAESNIEVRRAVDYIRSLGTNAPLSANSLATFLAEGSEERIQATLEPNVEEGIRTFSRGQIQGLKARVRNYPRNAIAWVDIARHYAMLGANRKAVQSMRIGLALSPDNRFVLRSAARLHVHLDEPDRAYDILRRSPATRRDPWLRAAEIAVAGLTDKVPARLRNTRRGLRGGNLDPTHISELASAVATLEMTSGSIKPARRLFNLGLQNPTENAVAQADWAADQISGISLREDHFRLPRTFEARAAEHFSKLEFDECVGECRRWSDDEPFASRPLEIGTFAAILGSEDYQAAIAFARRGLISNPKSFPLRNNLVVALAEAGCIDEAKREYEAVMQSNVDSREQIYWLATGGLLAFKGDDEEVGRKRYENAVAHARKQRDRLAEALALGHWAYEEFRAGKVLQADKRAEQAAQVLEVSMGLSSIKKIVLSKYERLKSRAEGCQ